MGPRGDMENFRCFATRMDRCVSRLTGYLCNSLVPIRYNTLGVLLETQSSRQRGTSRHRCRSTFSVVYVETLLCSCTSTSVIGPMNLAFGFTPSTSTIAVCRYCSIACVQAVSSATASCTIPKLPRSFWALEITYNPSNSNNYCHTRVSTLATPSCYEDNSPRAPLGCGESFCRFASSTL